MAERGIVGACAVTDFRNRTPVPTLAHRECRAMSSLLGPHFPAPNKQPRQGRIAMGFFSKDIQKMDDLFVHTLRDIYYAENRIVQALPEMIEKSSDPQLKQGLRAHLGETKN